MRELLLLISVSLMLQGCSANVDIPNSHAGVVKENGDIEDQVLKAGEHSMGFGSEVIVYDISPVILQIEVDFVFKDLSAGNLRVSLEFEPVVDSLSAFYKTYESIHITPIVQQETRTVVYNLMEGFGPNELSRGELERQIVIAATENYPIANYVDIHKVELLELKY